MSHTVLFCGTPEFAVASLRTLHHDDRFTVIGVVTQPDRPAGRGKEMQKSAVKEYAEQQGLPVFQPENINHWLPHAIEKNEIQKPDFLVVVAYGQILSKDVLASATIAPVNVHGSILPRWRGASPVEHAIMSGDTETGVTIQIMEEALDSGPILGIGKIPLNDESTQTEVREQLSELGARLLAETLAHPLQPVPQSKEGITFCTRLKREDGIVDPTTMTAVEIDRKVRALNPWPSVQCTVMNRPIKILRASLHETTGSSPLPCAHTSVLHLQLVQEAGKKPMNAADWSRGVK